MSGLLLAVVVVLAIALVLMTFACLVLSKLADQIARDFEFDDQRRLERMKAGQR